jgi:hypothetical protein
MAAGFRAAETPEPRSYLPSNVNAQSPIAVWGVHPIAEGAGHGSLAPQL